MAIYRLINESGLGPDGSVFCPVKREAALTPHLVSLHEISYKFFNHTN